MPLFPAKHESGLPLSVLPQDHRLCHPVRQGAACSLVEFVRIASHQGHQYRLYSRFQVAHPAVVASLAGSPSGPPKVAPCRELKGGRFIDQTACRIEKHRWPKLSGYPLGENVFLVDWRISPVAEDAPGITRRFHSRPRHRQTKTALRARRRAIEVRMVVQRSQRVGGISRWVDSPLRACKSQHARRFQRPVRELSASSSLPGAPLSEPANAWRPILICSNRAFHVRVPMESGR